MKGWAFLLVTACAGGEDVCADAPTVTWNSYGDGFFTEYCQGCHASTAPDRYGAPTDVTFDSEGQVRAWAFEIRERVRADGDAAMPPGGGVPEADLDLLETFLDCGG